MRKIFKILIALLFFVIFVQPGQVLAACDATTVNTCAGCPTGKKCTAQPTGRGGVLYSCVVDTSCSGSGLTCNRNTRGRCDVCTNNQICARGWAGLTSECKTVAGQCGAPWPAGCNQGNYLRCDVCPSGQQCLKSGSNFYCGTPTTACVTPAPTSPPGTTPTTPPTPTLFSPYDPPTNETFDMVNPLKIGGGTDLAQDQPSQFAGQLSSPGGIVSRVLTYAFPLAGLILFAMLTWGGFEMIMGAASKKSMDAGKQRATAAVVGFLILFVSYWVWQILEVVFGIVVF